MLLPMPALAHAELAAIITAGIVFAAVVYRIVIIVWLFVIIVVLSSMSEHMAAWLTLLFVKPISSVNSKRSH